MVERSTVDPADPRREIVEVDDAMRQALVTVARLQKAALEHVTVMIPGEWKVAATPAHPDPRGGRTP